MSKVESVAAERAGGGGWTRSCEMIGRSAA